MADTNQDIAINVRCKRRPRYIRAGVAFPFGTSTHMVTRAQLDILQADRAGALKISIAQTEPGTTDSETPAFSVDGVGDELVGKDRPDPEQEVVLGKDKLAHIVAALSNRPEDAPVVLNGEGKPDLAWLKKTLGEKVTAAERDAALSTMATSLE
ncbi:hypothetical protein ACW5XW_02930 [Aeromonas piscicola]|uniref:hypothetical protein n=1 Tax=Aeromonas piscicola TaxID=600645 RepID=UPI0005B358C4|nr:hypothetical protein [Aeromonas piscicola]